MYTRVDNILSLKDYEGKKVELVGKISETPWQHLVGFFHDYPYIEYFDVEDYQIIIYAKEQIENRSLIRVKGTVIKIEGHSKRPSKTGDNYNEYHLLVDEYVQYDNK